MRLIDIEPFETEANITSCYIQRTHSGDGFVNVAQTKTNEIPAADVVEVVRCKDCKYWQDNNGGYPHDECRWGKGETPDADDFCSYGERSAE